MTLEELQKENETLKDIIRRSTDFDTREALAEMELEELLKDPENMKAYSKWMMGGRI